jgi:hypothetical protein
MRGNANRILHLLADSELDTLGADADQRLSHQAILDEEEWAAACSTGTLLCCPKPDVRERLELFRVVG